MTSALIFGLLAAALWGTTDFMIRVASRRVGIFRAMLYAQVMSAAVVGAWIAIDPETHGVLREASAGAWAAAVIAAVTGLTATAALYQALHKGRVSVVAPVAAGYGAVTTLLSWTTGERLGAMALVGLGVLLAGVLLVSRPPGSGHQADPSAHADSHTSGLGWALLSCLGYGVEFWVQGRFANPQLGPLLPIGVYYLLSTSVLLAVGVVLRPDFRVSVREAILVCGTGLAAMAGFASLSAGFGTGHVAVVTAIGSVQSAITVALACLFGGDRLAVHHLIGLAAVIAGLVLIRLG